MLLTVMMTAKRKSNEINSMAVHGVLHKNGKLM